MAFDLKQESEVKTFIENLGIEYRFGCLQEKKPEVCHLLGDYLEGIKKDADKAGKVYKANCDDYHFAKSCYKFGNYTLVGKGHQTENHELAFQYYNKGCNLGEPDACLNAGLMCVSSAPHTANRPKDYTQGLALLEKGCEGKHAFCCYYISGLFISGAGEGSIKPDMEQAFQYSSKACELGNMYACANLSQMYRRGEGVTKSDAEADKYRKKALEMQEQTKSQQQLTFQEGAKPV